MIYHLTPESNEDSELWTEAQNIISKALKQNKLFLYDENYTYDINTVIFSNCGQINLNIEKEERE